MIFESYFEKNIEILQTVFATQKEKILQAAGVHIYAPAYCTVHTDNRFLYVLAQKTMPVQLRLPAPVTCRNLFTGILYENTDTISLELEEGTCAFLEFM